MIVTIDLSRLPQLAPLGFVPNGTEDEDYYDPTMIDYERFTQLIEDLRVDPPLKVSKFTQTSTQTPSAERPSVLSRRAKKSRNQRRLSKELASIREAAERFDRIKAQQKVLQTPSTSAEVALIHHDVHTRLPRNLSARLDEMLSFSVATHRITMTLVEMMCRPRAQRRFDPPPMPRITSPAVRASNRLDPLFDVLVPGPARDEFVANMAELSLGIYDANFAQ
jgi:hypothetical protein